MLKNISKLGKTLSKTQQRVINGGKLNCLNSAGQCVRYGASCAQTQCQGPDIIGG